MKKGISLVEIVLAIGVSIIMIGMVTAGYINNNKSQQVVAAAARLEQVVKEARSNAAAHKIDCSVCGCTGTGDTPLTGWKVTINGTGYQLQGICGALPPFMTRSEILPGVKIVTQNSASVTFKPYGQGTDINKNMTIKTSQPDGSQMQSFLVTPEGEIIP
jgi:Tfp pilus assembly protein FimT